MATIEGIRDMLYQAMAEGMGHLGKNNPTAALAGICAAFSVDVTLLDMAGSSSGRVLSGVGKLATTSLRDDVVGSGSKLNLTDTDGLTAVPAVSYGFEQDLSHVPDDLQAALVGAGVEPDVLASLYFDQTHGQTFRQRIKSKWRTFADLVSKGLIQSPTGFFVAAVRKNWHLSSTYEPGKKAPAKPAVPTGSAALPAAGSLVRVAGDLGRLVRVVSHRRCGGEWRTLLDDDGALSEVSSIKLRAG